MQFEALCNLIELATPQQLRSLARLVLKLQGYDESRITDGSHDGGSDLRVFSGLGKQLPFAIQTSVEKDWRKKLKADAATIKAKLKLDRVQFISSRRIPQASFLKVQAELVASPGVSVTPVDQQAIASLVEENRALPEVLQIFGLETRQSLPNLPADRRKDAAFAYAFFAPEPRTFRESIREQAVIQALSHVGGEAHVDDLCSQTAQLLGAPLEAPRLRSAVDRLRQSGRLQGRNGTAVLPPDERERLAALRSLREKEEGELREEVSRLLRAAKLTPHEDAVDAVMTALGALLLRDAGELPALDLLQNKVRGLRAELRAYGLPQGHKTESLMQALVECARTSPLGRHLAAGTLYQALISLDRDGLLRALDARSVSLVLDASVAIPMLCALFHGSVKQRFFLAAEEVHRRASELGFSLVLPEAWLEEMAAHLLMALDYRHLASAELQSLRMSKNAYVAYYANSLPEDEGGDLMTFLQTFGLTAQIAHRAVVDFHGARAQLESTLRRQIAHYKIDIVPVRYSSRKLQDVQRQWDWAKHDLGEQGRAVILQQHDTQVLAWLADKDPREAPLVVTWDRLLRAIRPDTTLDPLAVCDLLSFVRGQSMPAESLRYASLLVTEAEAERGANILDTLVRYEKDKLSDAKLVREMIEFKESYLRDRLDASTVGEIQREWQAFRRQREDAAANAAAKDS